MNWNSHPCQKFRPDWSPHQWAAYPFLWVQDLRRKLGGAAGSCAVLWIDSEGPSSFPREMSSSLRLNNTLQSVSFEWQRKAREYPSHSRKLVVGWFPQALRFRDFGIWVAPGSRLQCFWWLLLECSRCFKMFQPLMLVACETTCYHDLDHAPATTIITIILIRNNSI